MHMELKSHYQAEYQYYQFLFHFITISVNVKLIALTAFFAFFFFFTKIRNFFSGRQPLAIFCFFQQKFSLRQWTALGKVDNGCWNRWIANKG